MAIDQTRLQCGAMSVLTVALWPRGAASEAQIDVRSDRWGQLSRAGSRGIVQSTGSIDLLTLFLRRGVRPPRWGSGDTSRSHHQRACGSVRVAD